MNEGEQAQVPAPIVRNGKAVLKESLTLTYEGGGEGDADSSSKPLYQQNKEIIVWAPQSGGLITVQWSQSIAAGARKLGTFSGTLTQKIEVISANSGTKDPGTANPGETDNTGEGTPEQTVGSASSKSTPSKAVQVQPLRGALASTGVSSVEWFAMIVAGTFIAGTALVLARRKSAR